MYSYAKVSTHTHTHMCRHTVPRMNSLSFWTWFLTGFKSARCWLALACRYVFVSLSQKILNVFWCGKPSDIYNLYIYICIYIYIYVCVYVRYHPQNRNFYGCNQPQMVGLWHWVSCINYDTCAHLLNVRETAKSSVTHVAAHTVH